MSNKAIFSKNLQQYMKKNNVDRNKLVTDLDLKYMTISDWINKKTYPRIDKIELLANYFKINKSDLIEDKSNIAVIQTTLSQITETSSKLNLPRQQKVLDYAEQQLEEQNNIVKEDTKFYDFELYGYASAGTGQELLDEVIEVIQTPNKPPRHDIALQVVGDSMEPLFKDKEYIFVDTNAPIIDGMIGIVIVNNETYVKKVYVENNQLRLVSLNKDYEDIVVRKHDNYKFIGKVVL